ncbi:MAG: hypothetical protein Q4F09_03855 [Erysipelotrichaceae bacterium]|nr:hypothetical protein [Erysipelotrichaceae bacterium]
MFFLKPLLLTLVFECGLATVLRVRGKDLLLVFLVNLITNPLLSLTAAILYSRLSVHKTNLVIYLLLEPLIILAEAWIYRHCLSQKRNALLLSVLLNCFAILGGILWNYSF